MSKFLKFTGLKINQQDGKIEEISTLCFHVDDIIMLAEPCDRYDIVIKNAIIIGHKNGQTSAVKGTIDEILDRINEIMV